MASKTRGHSKPYQPAKSDRCLLAAFLSGNDRSYNWDLAICCQRCNSPSDNIRAVTYAFEKAIFVYPNDHLEMRQDARVILKSKEQP